MQKYILTVLLFLSHLFWLAGQPREKGIIEGRIYNARNNEPIPFANIVIWGTSIGSTSDLDGRFLFTGLAPGYVELRVTFVGFKPYVSEQILVTNANKVYIEIPLEETLVELDAVVVKSSPFRKSEESPVSLRRIGIEEIEKNPG
ncbi:MAG TPA: carboxypeptidase-like regulatory domain-containing protein, partial [Bacteroidales bacterium]|nr:carboxypeptidase-like regulatory domain-containing protein [Bacteroidales bacterium]